MKIEIGKPLRLKCKCLHCEHEFEGAASEDSLGWHTLCPKCGCSFDVDIPNPESAADDICADVLSVILSATAAVGYHIEKGDAHHLEIREKYTGIKVVVTVETEKEGVHHA